MIQQTPEWTGPIAHDLSDYGLYPYVRLAALPAFSTPDTLTGLHAELIDRGQHWQDCDPDALPANHPHNAAAITERRGEDASGGIVHIGFEPLLSRQIHRLDDLALTAIFRLFTRVGVQSQYTTLDHAPQLADKRFIAQLEVVPGQLELKYIDPDNPTRDRHTGATIPAVRFAIAALRTAAHYTIWQHDRLARIAAPQGEAHAPEHTPTREGDQPPAS